jgi:putative acetyltransferase
MTVEDYPDVIALWRSSEGLGLSDADEPGAIAAYLKRNPGLSLVATAGDEVVGAVLCGHDGRRGYLHHLAIARSHRGEGTGREIVSRCLNSLAAEGIRRCHIFVRAENESGQGFWRSVDWWPRPDLLVMTSDTPASGVAATGGRGSG